MAIDGPNVRQLTAHKMALDAIPPNGGLADGIKFLTGDLAEAAGRARVWVHEAIKAVRDADDPNPWRDSDDEAIAGEVLRQLDERKKP